MALDFVVLSLLAGVGYAVANAVDNVLLTDHLDHPWVRVFWYGLWAPVIAVPAFLLGATIPPIAQAVFPALAGAFFLIGTVFLMQAFQKGKVSRLALILQAGALLTVFLSIILLGEILTVNRYIGVGILILGAILASLDHPETGLPRFHLNRPLFLTIAATSLYSFQLITVKYSLGFLGAWDVFYWQQIGMAIVAPVLLMKSEVRREAVDILSARRIWAPVLILASASAYIWASLTTTLATSQAPVSIVAAIITINPLFLLVFIAILQRIGFEQFEEHLSRLEVIVKVLAAILFAIGVYLVK